MGKKSFFLVFFISLILAISPLKSRSQSDPMDPWDPANYEPGVVLLNFLPNVNVNSAKVQDLLGEVGTISYERTLPNIEPPKAEYVTRELLEKRRNNYKAELNKLEALRNQLDALKKAYSSTDSVVAKLILQALIDSLELEIRKTEREAKNARRSLRAPLGGRIPDLTRMYTLTLPEDADIHWVCDQLEQSGLVEWAEPNYYLVFFGFPPPNDPLYGDQDTLELIDVEEAWDLFPSESAIGDGVIVAVFDSGLDYTHPDFGFEDHDLDNRLDLPNFNHCSDPPQAVCDPATGGLGEDKNCNCVLDRGNVWVNEVECPTPDPDDKCNDGLSEEAPFENYIDDYIGWRFGGGRDVQDPASLTSYSHGTAVAGIIGAKSNNGVGIAGMTRNSKIMTIAPISTHSLAEYLINYAAFHNADVVNLSFGASQPLSPIDLVINYATSYYGIIFVAGSGNFNRNHLRFSPTSNPNTISVAAFDYNDNRLRYSNYGPGIDVSAPISVSSLYSGVSGQRYFGFAGTSAAAPVITSMVALYLSYHADDEISPGIENEITVDDIKQVLGQSSTDIIDPLGRGENHTGWDIYSGYGRVNVREALLTQNPTCAARFIYPPIMESVNYGQYVIVNGSFDVTGFASTVLDTPSTFNYTIKMGQGLEPASWTPLPSCGGTSIIENGTFCELNSDNLPDGMITLLLEVTDDNGTCETRTNFKVDNITITEPLAGLPTNGTISIAGITALPITSYTLSWGLGTDPTTWDPSGFTYNSTTTIDATFDTSLVPDKEEYTIRVVADLGTVSGSVEKVMLYKDNTIKPGWPRVLSQPAFSIIRVVDLDNDGSLEIIAKSAYTKAVPETGNQPMLYVLDEMGNDKWNWPVNIDEVYNSLGSDKMFNSRIAIGDLDNNGYKEIVYIEPNSETRSSLIHIFNYDGTPFGYGWPTSENFTNTISFPILYDVDSDNELEIIIYGMDKNYRMKVKIFNYDGTLHDDWTIANPDVNNHSHFRRGFAVSDVNNDGVTEVAITFGSDLLLYAIDPATPDADLLWSFSDLNYGPYWGYYGYSSQISLADIDFDSELEIILPDLDYMYVFNPDGTYQDWWPVPLTSLYIYMIDTKVLQTFSSSYPSIVGTDQRKLFSLTYDGSNVKVFEERFSGLFDTFRRFQQADIDGDGLREYVIQGDDSRIYYWPPFEEPFYRDPESSIRNDSIDMSPIQIALNANDTLVHPPQKLFGFGSRGSSQYSEPFLIDLDGDGYIENISGVGFTIDPNNLWGLGGAGGGAIIVRNTLGIAESGNNQPSQWRGNERNTGEFTLIPPPGPPDNDFPTINNLTVLSCSPSPPWIISADIGDNNDLPMEPNLIYFIDGVEQPAISMTGPFPGNGTYFAQIPFLSGSHVIKYFVRVIDVGNNITDSEHVTFGYDLIPPVIVSVTQDPPNVSDNVTNVLVTVIITDNYDLPIGQPKLHVRRVGIDEFDLNMSRLPSNTYRQYIGTSDWDDMQIEYYVHVTDWGCNYDQSEWFTFYKDTTPPTVTLVPFDPYADYIDDASGSYLVQANVTDNLPPLASVMLEYTIDGSTVTIPMFENAGYWEETIVGAVANGSEVSFTVTATDQLGWTDQASDSFTIDIQDPIITMTELPDTNSDAGPYPISVVVDENFPPLSLIEVTYTIDYVVGGQETGTLLWESPATSLNYNLLLPALTGAATVTYTAYAEDQVTNEDSETHVFIYDPDAPVITMTELPDTSQDGPYPVFIDVEEDFPPLSQIELTYVINYVGGGSESGSVTLTPLGSLQYEGELPTPVEAGTVTYTAYAEDHLGLNNTVTHVFIYDIPPVFLFTTDLPDTTDESGFIVQTIVFDEGGLDPTDPIVAYVSVDGAWLPTPFTPDDIVVSNGEWAATFNGPGVSAPTEICYYMEAKDNSGNSATDPDVDPQLDPYCFSVVYPFTPGSLFVAPHFLSPVWAYELNFRTGDLDRFTQLSRVMDDAECASSQCSFVGIHGFAYDSDTNEMLFTFAYDDLNDEGKFQFKHAVGKFDAAGNVHFIASTFDYTFAGFGMDIVTIPGGLFGFPDLRLVGTTYDFVSQQIGQLLAINVNPSPSVNSFFLIYGGSQPFDIDGDFYPMEFTGDALYAPGDPEGYNIVRISASDGSYSFITYPEKARNIYAMAYDLVEKNLYFLSKVGGSCDSVTGMCDYKIYSIPADPTVTEVTEADLFAEFRNIYQPYPSEIEYNPAEGYLVWAEYMSALDPIGCEYCGWTLFKVVQTTPGVPVIEDPVYGPQEVLDHPDNPLTDARYIQPPPGDIKIATVDMTPDEILYAIYEDVNQSNLSQPEKDQLNIYLLNTYLDFQDGFPYDVAIANLIWFQTDVETFYSGAAPGSKEEKEKIHFLDWSEVVLQVFYRLTP